MKCPFCYSDNVKDTHEDREGDKYGFDCRDCGFGIRHDLLRKVLPLYEAGSRALIILNGYSVVKKEGI